MGITISDSATGTSIIRPAEFEAAIRRACRLSGTGNGIRVYETKNRTRITVRNMT